MTAYLSKIAARFNGSPSGASSQGEGSIPVVLPVTSNYGYMNSSNPVSSFFTTPLASDNHRRESFDPEFMSSDTGQKELQPTQDQMENLPFETKRSFFHSDLFQTQENLSNPHRDQAMDGLVKPFKPQPSASLNTLQELNKSTKEFSATVKNSDEGIIDSMHLNSALPVKKPEILTASTSQQKQKTSEAKSLVPTEKRTIEKLPALQESGTEIKREQAFQQNLSIGGVTNKEILKFIPAKALLKPWNKAQNPALPTLKKNQNENKIRIGSIRVEIISTASHRLKTVPLMKREPTISPNKPSFQPTRFPLRFGLGQI